VGAGEELAARLSQSGYHVHLTSRRRSRLLRLIDVAVTVLRLAGRTDVQILQVYSGRSFVLEDVASWLATKAGHRIIMHVHGGAIPEFIARYPRWTRRVLRRADAIVVPSPYLQRALRQSGFPADVIPNAIEPSVYPFRPRRHVAPRLLWMRTFHPVYNPQMAVRVLARLRRKYPDATLVLAGQDKGIESNVRRVAEQLDLGSAVRFVGFLDWEAKIGEAGAADIFLNTTHIDNAPVSVIEACAMGLPVVTTAVGGVPDLVTHGRTALLVPDDDDAAMADAVERLLSDPELAERLSHNARELAEQLSWARTRRRWDAVIGAVVRRERGDECTRVSTDARDTSVDTPQLAALLGHDADVGRRTRDAGDAEFECADVVRAATRTGSTGEVAGDFPERRSTVDRGTARPKTEVGCAGIHERRIGR
jgi:glycosyltransferase involved in cell wall biosynthesis